MQDFLHKKIVVGISGGIAAYKSAYLVRELTLLGAEVRVVMTASAQNFITPMTMQALSHNAVRTELFDQSAESAMGHIELARWADYFVIAPASANCIAKLAHGLADDLLSTLYLVAEVPVIVCPAMNRSMWSHKATIANCEQLRRHGVIFVGPEEGSQACGEQGFGRLSEVECIVNALRLCEIGSCLQGRQVLITAGPTQEAIDPVRYISNRSSGKMGYALAEAAKMAGAEVTLISGPSDLPQPQGVNFHRVKTAVDMQDKVQSLFKKNMIFIAAAAVADYAVVETSKQKIKRGVQNQMVLELKPNPDILCTITSKHQALYSVGFAAETENLVENAKKKLQEKKLDLILANQVGQGIGFDVDENEILMITKEEQIQLSLNHKVRLAGKIIAFIATQVENRSIAFSHDNKGTIL